MSNRWITKKNKDGEKKRVRIEDSKVHGTKLKRIPPSAGSLEKEAWSILDHLDSVTDVDQLLLEMRRYSGLIGRFSPYNAMLIAHQDPDATIVRSKPDWNYFGRKLKNDPKALDVLYPIGIPRKAIPGEVKEFIEKKREEGLDDAEIDRLISEKFNINGTGSTHAFGTGSVYDISQTVPVPGTERPEVSERRSPMTTEMKPRVPGKEKPEADNIKATTLYSALKELAGKHYKVVEAPTPNARGYTAHSGDETMIRVMKVPGENVEALHTLIHEMSHANLLHLDRKIPRGIAEGEAELSTYLVGSHYGFDFKNDSSAYIKGWLNSEKDHKFGKENIDRCMNNARSIINNIDSILKDYTGQEKDKITSRDLRGHTSKDGIFYVDRSYINEGQWGVVDKYLPNGIDDASLKQLKSAEKKITEYTKHNWTTDSIFEFLWSVNHAIKEKEKQSKN